MTGCRGSLGRLNDVCGPRLLTAARLRTQVSPGVDSASPTGALGVYKRAGFEVEFRWNDYVLERPVVR